METKYYIGVDTASESTTSPEIMKRHKHHFCLIRKTGELTEVLLAKEITDKKEFDEEVNNLAKYFNATLKTGK